MPTHYCSPVPRPTAMATRYCSPVLRRSPVLAAAAVWAPSGFPGIHRSPECKRMRRDALTSLHYSSNAAAATSGADARSNRSESPRPFLVMDYDDDNELDDDDDEIASITCRIGSSLLDRIPVVAVSQGTMRRHWCDGTERRVRGRPLSRR